MSATDAILKRLKTTWYGPAWHGPAVREVLAGITAQVAASHVIAGAHSIWEIVNHIAAWREAAIRGIREGAATVAEDENFPGPVDGSDEEWNRVLERFTASEERLLECVASLRDQDLARTVQGMEGMFTTGLMLEGVADHDLYHAGQVTLLRKACGAAR